MIKSDRWIRRMAESHQMIEPFEPAEAVIVNVSMAKVTAIVWFAVTFVNV